MTSGLYKTFVIDLDGVVYRGKDIIEGANDAIAMLRNAGKHVLFLTNNSTTLTSKVANKLVGLGIPCAPNEIMTSARGAAKHLEEHFSKSNDGVLVFGTDDFKAEVQECGVSIASFDDCNVLVVGYNPNFTHEHLAQATWALQRPGVEFIVCNLDPNYPGENGRLMPGCGALVSAIETASGRKASLEIGKPNPFILDILLKEFGLTREGCVIIGDSDYSDIELARRANVASVFITHKPAQNKTPHRGEAQSLLEAVKQLLT